MRLRPLAILVLASIAVLAPDDTTSACWRPPVIAPITDRFRPPACRWCAGNRGLEFATEPGTSVRAVATGRVSFAGSVAGTIYVVVRLADGRRVTYGGLADRHVGRGDLVLTGAAVGTTAGRLHLGVRDRDRYVDPEPFLGRFVRRPWLIPTDGGAGALAPPARLRCRS